MFSARRERAEVCAWAGGRVTARTRFHALPSPRGACHMCTHLFCLGRWEGRSGQSPCPAHQVTMGQSQPAWANRGAACCAGAEKGSSGPEERFQQDLSVKCRTGGVSPPLQGTLYHILPGEVFPTRHSILGGWRGKGQGLRAPVGFGTGPRPATAMERSIFPPGGRHNKGHRHHHHGYLPESEDNLERESIQEDCSQLGMDRP